MIGDRVSVARKPPTLSYRTGISSDHRRGNLVDMELIDVAIRKTMAFYCNRKGVDLKGLQFN